jgi:hypothetical protein
MRIRHSLTYTVRHLALSNSERERSWTKADSRQIWESIEYLRQISSGIAAMYWLLVQSGGSGETVTLSLRGLPRLWVVRELIDMYSEFRRKGVKTAETIVPTVWQNPSDSNDSKIIQPLESAGQAGSSLCIEYLVKLHGDACKVGQEVGPKSSDPDGMHQWLQFAGWSRTTCKLTFNLHVCMNHLRPRPRKIRRYRRV